MTHETKFEWLGDKDILVISDVQTKGAAKVFAAGVLVGMAIVGGFKARAEVRRMNAKDKS